MTKKPDDINDSAYAMKMVGNLFLSGLDEFRRRHVGWIPFLAFWVNVTYVIYDCTTQEGKSSWHSMRVALIYMIALPIYSALFFTMATVQYFSYRKRENQYIIFAVLAMVLHGAALAFSAFVWITVTAPGH
jgi:hypothetical protein